MKFKHTPGPWSVPHFAKPDVDCECKYVLTERMCGAVCSVHCSGEGHWEKTGDNPKFDEAVANAHLISASPDLLKSLVSAYSLLAKIDNQWVGRHTQEGQLLLCNMRDAIAKATNLSDQEVQDYFSVSDNE